MAEHILVKLGGGKFKAYSAGCYPIGRVNPLSIEELRRREYPADELFSKSWLTFADSDSIAVDYIVYVCENAASVPRPAWNGSPLNVYWKFPSPGSVQGTDAEVRTAFFDVCEQIETCVKHFLSLSANLEDRQLIHKAFIDAPCGKVQETCQSLEESKN